MYRLDTADAWRRRIKCCTCPQIFLLLCGCMQRFLPNSQFHRRDFWDNALKYERDFRLRRTRHPRRFPRPKADKLQTPKGKEVHDLCSLHSLPIYRIYLPVFCNFLRTFLTYSLAPLFLNFLTRWQVFLLLLSLPREQAVFFVRMRFYSAHAVSLFCDRLFNEHCIHAILRDHLGSAFCVRRRDFFTPSTRRTTSPTCVSHIPQRIPSTSNVILSIFPHFAAFSPSSRQAARASSSGALLQMSPSSIITPPAASTLCCQVRIHSPSPQS